MQAQDNRPQVLDKFNLKIVTSLHQNGRITKVELSERVGLSPTPCWERMKRLEHQGVIRGYHADIDITRMFYVSYFRVEVSIRNLCPERARNFERYVRRVPEILDCEAVLGDVAYILKMAAVSVENYQAAIEKFQSNSPVEFDYTTYPVTKIIKDGRDVLIQDMYESLGPPT